MGTALVIIIPILVVVFVLPLMTIKDMIHCGLPAWFIILAIIEFVAMFLGMLIGG